MSERTGGFEEVLEELERIVQSLEDDELDLADALRRFERGVELLRRAAGLLDAAHGRVEELVEGLSGDLGVVEFDAPIVHGDEQGSADV